jgi:hypothetical protein
LADVVLIWWFVLQFLSNALAAGGGSRRGVSSAFGRFVAEWSGRFFKRPGFRLFNRSAHEEIQ